MAMKFALRTIGPFKESRHEAVCPACGALIPCQHIYVISPRVEKNAFGDNNRNEKGTVKITLI